MISYTDMTQQQLLKEKQALQKQYYEYCNMGLKLDMSRGKPCAEQLDLSMGILTAIRNKEDVENETGFDTRNYGILDGIPEAKRLFSKMINVCENEIIIGGNSSLNLMYDTIVRGLLFGFVDSSKPWKDYSKIKFLCPCPGYDRHFAICEVMGIEMINIPMTDKGPDMDMVEQLVINDDTIKGIWCVPKYSNPQGITYSDEVVRRLASMNTKDNDFRIFWDNAYCVHHLTDTPDVLLDLFEECKKVGNQNRPFIFGSTSKISFPGAGVSFLGASEENINFMKKQLTVQTIGYDKLNQLSHVKFFKDLDGINKHMDLHRQILKPKFDVVINTLKEQIAHLKIASWSRPNGGYFISLDTLDGCAKRVIELCKNAGVVMTDAGATYPYGYDPKDSNIRIAPSFPPVEELKLAMNLLCLCLKLASIEKLLS